MIVDLILDRKDGVKYNAKRFYNDIRDYESIFNFEPAISLAMDYGTESDVQKALCDYIIRENYNPDICNYIRSVSWLK